MSLVGFAIIFALILVVLLTGVIFFGGRRGRNVLLRHGVAGTAVIVSVQPTAERVGDMLVANVALDVTPEIGPGFRAVAKQVITPSTSYLFNPGRQVPVRYDRRNRSNIIVVTNI